MRIVVQRCKYAKCTVDNEIKGSIDKGFLLFIGFTESDTINELDLLLRKTIGLRIFEDENGKMNRSLKDVNGEILAISQFTLYADCKHGNRPSFTSAMKYDKANEYYELFCKKLEENNIHVERGVFGSDMKIELLNDGPVTIILDSDEL
ncbi:MAG: D-tyrosyl-tRNA(Tyr) deacylase [Acholeplasmatales bacterium]|nr:D-tyrosyl-tRNA(Tyr) deacylase [Acholeplasmatales bacterium]